MFTWQTPISETDAFRVIVADVRNVIIFEKETRFCYLNNDFSRF